LVYLPTRRDISQWRQRVNIKEGVIIEVSHHVRTIEERILLDSVQMLYRQPILEYTLKVLPIKETNICPGLHQSK
jgi:hypothetical protein